MIEPIYTDDPSRPRKILAGHINRDTATFRKEVTRKRHYLNVASGYAIQKDVFDSLLNEVAYVQIHEKDTGDTYYSLMETWKDNAWLFSKGHGDQMAMSTKLMTKK